jgi:superfamily II DNA or RNA helicase
MPTGTGKSRLFATVARDLGWPTLVLCHRDELVQQNAATVRTVWPEARVGIIKAETDEWQDGQTVVVASVQSLHARRLAQMPRDRFGLVVADEAHHAVADSWTAILEHFQSRFLLGTTATPDRFDGKGLDDLFGPKPIFTYDLRQAVEDGRLVRPIQYAVRTGIDLDNVRVRAGDFAENDLALAVGTRARNRVVVEAFEEYAANRRAICFAVDLEHVRTLAEAFNEAGIAAATVTGQDSRDTRRSTLQTFAAGRYRVLVNCEICTEGFDDPAVGCIIMARPTKSRSLYAQMVGRGFRLCPETDKQDCLVLDFVDNSSRHKLVTVFDLFGSQHVRDAKGGDVLDAVDREAEEEQDRVERINREPSCPLKWRLQEVSPWPQMPSLKDYAPRFTWESNPATESQVACLRKFGMEPKRNLTKGEASHLINKAIEYENKFPAPATYKQMMFLRFRGQWIEGMSKREASKVIGEIKGRAAV